VKILGYIPTSFSDWDGRLTSVVFVGGCNFNCPFCQNYPLLEEPRRGVGSAENEAKGQKSEAKSQNGAESETGGYSWAMIAEQLAGRTQWIDGVVISGGEPLLHPEVIGLCERIKKLGLAVKLDTNGSFPYVLMKLADRKLVDYVAMDVKTAVDERYEKACGEKIETGLVERSLSFLLEGKLDYELRTTLVPGLVGKEEITAIARRVKGARRYALQQFVPENARTAAFRKRMPYTRAQVTEFSDILGPAVKQLVVRGKVLD
jgi:pyruvate formate lyase activating enzyme